MPENITPRLRGRPKSFHDKTQSATINSLDRALHILNVVSESPGLSLTDIAEIAEQSTATTYRVLTTMKLHAMVEFEETTQVWNIGAGAFRIGSSFLRRTRLAEQSRQFMEQIMQKSGETANLAIIDQNEVVFISQVETHAHIRAFFRPGTRGPIHTSGIGKAILAHQSADQWDSILKVAQLERFTHNTITTKQNLYQELELICARGWAVDDEERTPGMRCIAAPIFNQFSEAVAGVSISGPTVRMTPGRDSELGALVRATADKITIATGGRLPDPFGRKAQ